MKLTILVWTFIFLVSCGNPMGGGDSVAVHERVGEGGSQYDAIKTPVVSGITPVIGSSSGGTMVFISGDNFYTDISSVKIGANDCHSVVRLSKSSLRCIVPAAGIGIVDVIVSNDNGEPANAGKTTALSNGFEYRTANNPAHMFMAQGLQTGSDFVTQSGSDFLTGDNIIIEKIVEGI